MRTLTVEEAVTGLARWVEGASAGGDIRIRSGDTVVAQRPVPQPAPASRKDRLSPREALQRLQAETRLTPEQAQQYLNEVHHKRLAAKVHRLA